MICWPRSNSIQRAAMKPIRAGAMGKEIYAAAAPLVAKSKHHNHMEFLAHGMGMVSHEAPRLTDAGRCLIRPKMPNGRSKRAWWCRSKPR